MTERMPSSLYMLNQREGEALRQHSRETDEGYRIKENYNDLSR